MDEELLALIDELVATGVVSEDVALAVLASVGGGAEEQLVNPFFVTLPDPAQEVFSGQTFFQERTRNLGLDPRFQAQSGLDAPSNIPPDQFAGLPGGIQDDILSLNRRFGPEAGPQLGQRPGLFTDRPDLGEQGPPSRLTETVEEEISPEQAGAVGSLGGNVRREDAFTTVGDLLQEFYELERNDLVDLQQKLFVGGFYGPNVKIEDVQWGQFDDQSFSAWASAVARTARFTAAGRRLTVDDVIEAAGVAAQMNQKPEEATPTETVIVSLTDPNTIREIADLAGRQGMGREATAEEEQLIIRTIHAAQRTQALQTAFSEGIVPVTNVDVRARVAGELERLNPVEHEGFATGQQVNVLRDLITGGR